MKRFIFTILFTNFAFGFGLFAQGNLEKQKSLYNYIFDKVGENIKVKNYNEKGKTEFKLSGIEYFTMDSLVSKINGYNSDSKYYKIQTNSDFNNGYAVKLFFTSTSTNEMFVLYSYEFLGLNNKYTLYYDHNKSDIFILNK